MDHLYRISNELLLEYNYTKEYRSLTSTPILIMKSSYNGSSYLFNDDSQEIVTGNVRDLSSILVANGEYVSLNIDSTPYNDIDDKLTNSLDLSQVITNNGLYYDIVRIHILTGYNFENTQGFNLEFRFKDPFGQEHFLTTYLFDKATANFEINPRPLIAEERVYNKYIELRIPNLKSIIDSYTNNSQDLSELGNILTNNKGLTFQQNLTVNYLNLNKVTTRGAYRFYNVTPENNFTIPLKSSYSAFSASVEESTNGDFYELSGRYEDSTIENFILELNSGSDADWIILHGIDIIEQIVDTGFVMTQSYNLTQIDNFEQPIFFRPVVLNAEWAISWTIDYTVSLYNQATGERIGRNSKRTFLDPKKWGRSLRKINLGTSPIIDEIYNKIEQPVYQVNVTEARAMNRIKTVLSFVQSNDVLVETKTDFGGDFDGKTRWGQRELNLPLSNSDNFYNFKISKRSDSGFASININSSGIVIMRFIVSNDEFIDIVAEPDSLLSRGETTFKINQLTSQKVNSANISQFFIILKSDEDESIIYEGKVLNSLNVTESNITNLNISLKREIAEQENNITDLGILLEERKDTIKTNEDKIVYLRDINNLYLRKIELLENNIDTTQINSVIENRLRNSIDITENVDLSRNNTNKNSTANKVTINRSVGTYKNI